MIRRSRAQSSSLFLMELILAIFFFSITSAVCVQFFVKSHLLVQESKALAQAVNECSNIAELYDASDSIEEALSLLEANYSNVFAEHGVQSTAVMYYDASFSPCRKGEASYSLNADFTEENSMLKANIRVTDSDGSVIYELNTDHHIPGRTDYEER